METIDFGIIVVYFLVVLGAGFWYLRKASQNLESYFLGGKQINWLMLAMSGSVSNFDITGTMWIVSMLYILGMRSIWIHWMWGFMLGAFCLAFMGKWVRRSNVMTAAEWMTTRFGSGKGGVVARTAYAIMAVLTQASFIGYAFQGIGKFASVYLPFSPNVCAFMIIGITTLYVILGGLYSVVITDVIQTFILTLSAIIIAVIAFQALSPDIITSNLPHDWTSLVPKWRLSGLAGTENKIYELFGALVIVWVLKGLLLNSGGPAQMYDFQRYLAARDSRDAAKIGAAWSFFLIPRWGMATAIVLLALIGFGNVSDPEKVMPLVLKQYLPTGIRGLVVAGLLAAFMSTFSSTVNSGASYIVRDFWQAFFRTNTTEKQLVMVSYAATIAIVVLGFIIGLHAESIAQIWNWMMMALGAGVIMPNVLRWYWWRMTGWGYAAGIISGIVFSLIILLLPEIPMYVSFPVISIASLLASVVVSIFTRPVDKQVLENFFQTVRPVGYWRPVYSSLKSNKKSLFPKSESLRLAIVNTGLGIVAIIGYYLFPMYLVGHWYWQAVLSIGPALTASLLLYFTWYRNLPISGKDF